MENRLKDKIIAVDLDGTILEYDEWRGPAVFGEPLQGAKWALEKFKEMGAIIVVHTCRKMTDKVEQHLRTHKIPFDYINFSPRNKKSKMSEAKIGADIYIDDRGLPFRGEWHETYKAVVNFRRWGKELGSAISSKGL